MQIYHIHPGDVDEAQAVRTNCTIDLTPLRNQTEREKSHDAKFPPVVRVQF